MEQKGNLFEQVNLDFLNQHSMCESQPTDSNLHNNGKLVGICVTYFKMGYYTCAIPFKPVFNSKTSRWQLETSKFQKIICMIAVWAFFWFTMISNYLKLFINGFPPSTKLTAKFYFVQINNVLNLVKILLFLINITKYSEKIEVYLNQLAKLKYNSNKAVIWSDRLIKVFYVMICSGTLLPNFITTETLPGSPMEVFQKYVSIGRTRFFMDAGFDNYSTLNIFLGIFELLSLFCMTHILWFHYAFYMCPLPFSFWLVVNELEKSINEITSSFNRATSLKEFEDILQLIEDKVEQTITFCDSVNIVWAVSTLIWVMDFGIRFMIYMNDLVKSRDWVNIIVVFVWYINIGIALTLSAETYRKIETVRSKLTEKFIWESLYEANKKKLKRVLRELEDQSIGIGTKGLYKLDYGFIAQFLLALTTIFLVSFEDDVRSTLEGKLPT